MNWTEGSLARHSRGRQRNALIARQKQHFAKARSNLLSGRPNQGPVKISFLASESSSESSRRVLLRQKHRGVLSSPKALIKQESRPEYPARLHDESLEVLATNLERRKRLLEKSDWAGLGLQKPLEISFPGQIYATRRWTRAIRPPETTPNQAWKHTTTQGEPRHDRLKRSSMRIRIGSQEVRPSIATVSQSSSKRRTLVPEQTTHVSRPDLMSDDSRYMYSSERERYGHPSTVSYDIPRALNGPEMPINVVYSSPVIHEPAPRRNDDFQVLHWSPSGSEDRGSMQVEMGQPVEPASPSQASEQQRWRDWVLAGDALDHLSNSSLVTTDTAEIDSERPSSDLTLPSHLQPRLPSLHLSSEAEIAPGHNSSGYISTEDNRCPPEKYDLLPSNQRCAPPKKPVASDDLNSIWMKFVFGDEYNSDELLMDAFQEAAHQAAVELRPSDTSDSAAEHTGNTPTCITELSYVDHGCRYGATPHEYSDSNMATKGTIDSETVSSNIATVGSIEESLSSSKHFTLPKVFIGKNVSTDKSLPARAFAADAPRSSRKGGRKRRMMATDGRPNIRSLPDFSGDPIEEIEDD